MTTGRFFTLFVALSALSGCAAYPPLAAIPAPAAGQDQFTDVATIIEAARTQQETYRANYGRAAEGQDLAQLPIIGIAAAAAWVLLDNGPGAARQVGRLGIVAGGYSAARDQAMPAGLPETYIAGYSALACVIAEGHYFTGQSAAATNQRFTDSLDELAVQISATEISVNEASLVAPSGTVETATREAALRLITSALENARTAERAARVESGAFLEAPTVFRQALAVISTRVATRGRRRPEVSYAALRDSLGPPGQGAAQQSGDTLTATQWSQRLISNAGLLLQMTNSLTANVPPYAARLRRVAACPDQAS